MISIDETSQGSCVPEVEIIATDEEVLRISEKVIEQNMEAYQVLAQ